MVQKIAVDGKIYVVDHFFHKSKINEILSRCGVDFEGDFEKQKQLVGFQMIDPKQELEKCFQDIVYFAEHYFHVQQSNWWCKLLKLNDFQRDLLKNMQSGNFKISALSERRAGKTVLCLVYCAWRMMFFADKTILLIEPTKNSVDNVFQILKIAFEKMPDWLKPTEIKNVGSSFLCRNNASSIHIETHISFSHSFVLGLSITDYICDDYSFDNWLSKVGFFSRILFPHNFNELIISSPNSKSTNFAKISVISRAISKGKSEWLVVKKSSLW